MKKTIRFLIDAVVLGACGAFVIAWTSSYVYSFAAAVAIAAYGFWCFADGASS